MADTRPIVISCGEPAGIGLDIIPAAWNALRHSVPMAWIGDPSHLPPDVPVRLSDNLENQDIRTDALTVLARDFGAPRTPGVPNALHAPHVVAAIETGVQLCQSGAARGLCTAPIHKAALIDGAEFDYPGHTEFLSALAGDVPVAMMLACDQLRVVPVTIHVPLCEVPDALTAAALTDAVLIVHAALRRDFGIKAPRIAIAGLNPHAGEDGKIGTEELTLIRPVIDALRERGLNVSGPHSADTMFHAQARQSYDAAICMYHDQALIPIKTLDFFGGVNVTLGLPFIRTSPDHGTAFEIAGSDQADARSMIAAIQMAAQMADARES